jgi:hypothetical protein
MPTNELLLFIDDTGSRDPDRKDPLARGDGMNCFAFGGFMIRAADVEALKDAHRTFCARWSIDYPLHSYEIRGGRGDFGWLKNPSVAFEFLTSLEQFMLDLPVIGIAAVVDRPGYVARYRDVYRNGLWFMCRTAYSILIERAARYADEQGCQLRVYFEGAGRDEDRSLLAYAKELKQKGMPFSSAASTVYNGLSAADFQRIILGDPIRQTKNSRMMQIADLMLYPMAKGGYAPTYRPYRALMDGGKLIDSRLLPDQIPTRGIKYSCFEAHKTKGPAGPGLLPASAKR